MSSLQQDFAYLIAIAEEIQGLPGSQVRAEKPAHLAVGKAIRGSADHTSPAMFPAATAPQDTPSPLAQQPMSRPDPTSGAIPPSLNTETGQFAVDLGVVSPMYLAALHVQDRSLRARALAVMRSAGALEGFWNGEALADLLEKIFAATEGHGIEDGGDGNPQGERCDDHKPGVGTGNSSNTRQALPGEAKGGPQPAGRVMYGKTSLLDGVGLTITGGSAIPGLMERLQGLRL